MFADFFIHLYTWHPMLSSQISSPHPASRGHTAHCIVFLSVTSDTEDLDPGQRPTCHRCQGLVPLLEHSCSSSIRWEPWKAGTSLSCRRDRDLQASALLCCHTLLASLLATHTCLWLEWGPGWGAPCPFLLIPSQKVHLIFPAIPSWGDKGP